MVMKMMVGKLGEYNKWWRERFQRMFETFLYTRVLGFAFLSYELVRFKSGHGKAEFLFVRRFYIGCG